MSVMLQVVPLHTILIHHRPIPTVGQVRTSLILTPLNVLRKYYSRFIIMQPHVFLNHIYTS